MNIQEIQQALPHRYPFLLIDRVLECVPERHLVAIKNVTANEQFFQGHFPQRMVMPGVLILEALAQAAGICMMQGKPRKDNTLHLFAGIDHARFKRMVEPGDQLRLEVEFLRYRQGIWRFKGIATVDGQLACSAEMISATRDDRV